MKTATPHSSSRRARLAPNFTSSHTPPSENVSIRKALFLLAWMVCSLFVSSSTALADEKPSVSPLLADVLQVSSQGKGHAQAITAIEKLQQSDAAALPEILSAMNGANPLALNWLRGAFEAIAERQLHSGKPLPLESLAQFLRDTKNAPRARRLAYEWIVRCDPQAEARWIDSFLNDQSLELRRDAVAAVLAAAETAAKKSDSLAAKRAFRQALSAARDEDQIKLVASKLKEMGEPVDLASVFGFVQNWWILGPFDNHNKIGFAESYPPEKVVDLAAKLPGKDGEIAWKEVITEDEMGKVDLNKALAKHKGALAYAFTEFVATEPREIELRLGCIVANKVWLNGELLFANEVYHAGTQLDQYAGRGKLKAGKNTILLKICQNEQEEEWAQDWEFQLRVCDSLGAAVLAANRPPHKTAEKKPKPQGQ